MSKLPRPAMFEDDEPCERCEKEKRFIGGAWDPINEKIWHDNGHVWPGFAGEPTGDDFGGSDF